MLFMAGINQMGSDEKNILLAQLNALNGWNALNEGMQRGVKGSKDFLLSQTSHLMKKMGASHHVCQRIDHLNSETNWDTEVIRREIERNLEMLRSCDQLTIDEDINKKLTEIAGVERTADPGAIASGVVDRAARAMKIQWYHYPNKLALEEAVFEACIKEQVELLKKRVDHMSASEMAQFELILRQELEKLSQVDQEAIRKATGLENLSATTVVKFIKTTSGTALAQLAVGMFGFGAYLFITTALHALSLLLGVTFSFGVYTAATSTLAFVLSGPFFLLVTTLSGGYLLYKTSDKIKDQLAKMLILSGRAKILQS